MSGIANTGDLIAAQDLEFFTVSTEPFIRSPNGTHCRFTVDNAGALEATAV